MSIIETKQDYYRLAQLGALGNTLKTWPHPRLIPTNEPTEIFAIRFKDKAGSKFITDLTKLTLDSMWNNLLWPKGKYKNEDMMVCEQDKAAGKRLLTGFVMLTIDGLHLEYSELDLLVRDAMRIDHHIKNVLTGLRAKLKMQSVMEPIDYDFLNDLFQEYPDSIIEFTTFEKFCGYENRKTIFWEVRNY